MKRKVLEFFVPSKGSLGLLIQDSTITVSLLVSVFCIQIFDCKDIFHRVEVVSTEICQEEGEEDKDESLAGR